MKSEKQGRSSSRQKRGLDKFCRKKTKEKAPKKTPSDLVRHEWNDSYALGVKEIDAQHRSWFEMTSAVLDAAKENAERDTIQSLLKEAFLYASQHFKAEEAFMKSIRLPSDVYDWHVMSHNAFVQRVNALAEKNRTHPKSAMEQTACFMSGWLTKHIMEYDVAYITFYERRNWGGR